MNVTPTDKMFRAMQVLTDAICGEEPSALMIGPGAEEVREKRRLMMDTLHKLVAVSMRVGAGRALHEQGYPVVNIDGQRRTS